MNRGLGTQLRHLIELLDGDVAQAYVEAGLSYLPRYTPVMRVLAAQQTATIGQIARAAGITQPAATQTVARMHREGLITVEPGQDARQRLVRLSAKGSALMPQLQACWAATKAAADGLDAELPVPLSKCLADAIAALERRPFAARIRAARESATDPKGSS